MHVLKLNIKTPLETEGVMFEDASEKKKCIKWKIELNTYLKIAQKLSELQRFLKSTRHLFIYLDKLLKLAKNKHQQSPEMHYKSHNKPTCRLISCLIMLWAGALTET